MTDHSSITAFDEAIKAARAAGIPCSLLFVDLDHFAQINAIYGHAIGDVVLEEVASLLGNMITLPAFTWREYADDYRVVLPGVNRQRAYEWAERARGYITQRSYANGTVSAGSITCAIGLSTYPDDTDDAMGDIQAIRTHLWMTCDFALQAAKHDGGNTIGQLPA